MAEELHAGESVPLESDVEEEEAPSPRRRIGRRITREMAEIIQNVSSACEEEKKANFRFHLGQAVRRTAYFTGVSQREISKIRRLFVISDVWIVFLTRANTNVWMSCTSFYQECGARHNANQKNA